MSVLITADLHLGDNRRDDYRHDFVQYELPKMLEENEAERLLILGDLTDAKTNRQKTELVNDVVEHIAYLAKICPITILQGNHDYLHPEHPFFGFLDRLKNVTWINKPIRLPIPELGGQCCLFLPHTRNYQRDWKGFDFVADWIFAHNTFTGAYARAGHELEGIPIEVFPVGALVVSGDIHVPQLIPNTHANVRYVGAPYRIDFGDTYEPRVLVLEAPGCFISVPCPGPRKQLIELDYDGMGALNSFKVQPKDILKVRITLPTDAVEKWDSFAQQVADWARKQKCVVSSIHPVLLQNSSKRPVFKGRDLVSDSELLCAYGKRRGVSEPVLKTGLDLLQE